MRARTAAALAGMALLGSGCDLEKEIGAGDDRMPAVVGKSARDANAALDGRGFTPSYGTSIPIDDTRCRVVKQASPPGSRIEPYSTQALRCVARVPRVVGLTADDADTRLQRSGFDVDLAGGKPGLARGSCRVVAQSGRREERPQTDIRLSLRC